jgi:hypothetical protein
MAQVAQLEIRQAFLRFKESASPRLFLIIPLSFDAGPWLIGRKPEPSALWDSVGISNPALTASLMKISAVRTNQGAAHILQVVAPLDPVTQEPKNPILLKHERRRIAKTRVLQDRDTLVVEGIGLELMYRLISIEDLPLKVDDTII